MGFGGGRREPCHFLASTRSDAEGVLSMRDMWFGQRRRTARDWAVSSPAGHSICETRLLVGQQAAAFTAAALPLCRKV